MTKRRIIQNSLQRLAHLSLDTRNRWILAARAVAPRYNVELKASQEAVRDLTPRIEELKERQKEKLVRQLTDARSTERMARLTSLQEAVDTATRRHQGLSDEFLKIDSQATQGDQAIAAETQELQRQIQAMRDEITAREKEVGELDAEISRVKASGIVSAPGSAKYASLNSVLTPTFDLAKKDRAMTYGAGAAILFMLIGWALTSSKRTRPAIAHKS
jgi:DNA repair exonuclease SbcCD ATPase subunit